MRKLSELFKQIFSFGIVGAVCFIIDFLLLIFLTDVTHLDYMLSAAIAFILSTMVNYILSMRFVFVKKVKMDPRAEFIAFFVMSMAGLLLTEAFMLLFVEAFAMHYTISKVMTTLIVMAYNYISRKLFFEKSDKKRGD